MSAFKVVLFLAFAFVAVSMAAQPRPKPKYNDPQIEAQLARLSAEELVREYARVYITCHSCGNAVARAIEAKDPTEVCTAIAKVLDEYDPTTKEGRKHRKPDNAYWGLGFLDQIDNFRIRIRAVENGSVVLAAYRRMLDRKKAAGHNVKPNPYNDRAYARQMVYEAETSGYQELMAVNEQDRRISQWLKAEHQIQLTDDELRRFSDFLLAKDPHYVAWGDWCIVSKDPPRVAFRTPQRYYDAYLEFKSAATRQ